MKKSEIKTNAIRLLEQKKIPFSIHHYVDSGAVSGMEVAEVLGENPEAVFKTLVTVGKSGEHYVFVVPVNKELNLKKAANVAGEKIKGVAAAHRLYSWRLFSYRDEEVF